MSIRRGYHLFLAIGLVLIGLAVLSAGYSQQILVEDIADSERLDRIFKEGMQLVQLSHAVNQYDGPRGLEQWRLRHEALATLIKSADGMAGEPRVAFERILSLDEQLRSLIDKLGELRDAAFPDHPPKDLAGILSSQIFLDASQLHNALMRLSEAEDGQLEAAYRKAKERQLRIFSVFLGLFTVYGVLLTWTFQRAVLEPLRALKVTIDAVRAGENRKAAVGAKDEIGLVCRTFNDLLDEKEAGRKDLARLVTRFQSVFEQSAMGLSICDPAGRWLEVNRRLCDMLGYSREQLLGMEFADITHFRQLTYDRDRWQALLSAQRSSDSWDGEYCCRDGQVIWARITTALTRNNDASPQFFVTAVEEITQQRQTETNLRLMAKVFDNLNEAILITDERNRIIATNPAFSQLTGYSSEDAWGKNPRFLSAGKTPQETYQQMWNDILDGGYWQGELWDRRKTGEPYPKWMTITVMRDQAGRITNHIASFVDISERKASEEKVRHLAHYDALTDLPNRLCFLERLEQAIGYTRRQERKLALLMIDLDRFKTINDTLGHHVGDQLLVAVADRLTESVRDSDIVARLGGDEFIIALPGIEDRDDAINVAEKVIRRICEPFTLEGSLHHTSPSIGLCIYPDDAIDITELMKKADLAMYQAKGRDVGSYQFFTADMTTVATNRLALESYQRPKRLTRVKGLASGESP
ncbi:MAG TPA: diguanylate cyclase [Rhodospirillaceae bacterium]|nr:diguanylate cyclase [Rhodospirillaceae bacterium]